MLLRFLKSNYLNIFLHSNWTLNAQCIKHLEYVYHHIVQHGKINKHIDLYISQFPYVIFLNIIFALWSREKSVDNLHKYIKIVFKFKHIYFFNIYLQTTKYIFHVLEVAMIFLLYFY